jgi:protein involved in sex pheromone biosynthesis
MVIYTQEGYSVATVLEYVAAKPMEDGNVIEAVNGFLTDMGKVRILDEHTHSADNYIQIEAAYLSEEAANRWLAKGGRF